jgi:hypothetical protein
MASICTSNVTSGFIDLATFDEIEKYLYGGPDATAYFVRETRKSTWFTQVPVVLSRAAGSPAFGQEWSVAISRAGDYMLQTWLRLTTPSVTLNAVNAAGNNDGRIRWTRNFMHNIIRECCITFNDLVAARFDNYHLDFWAAFTVPAGKRNGYNNMIGTFDDMTAPTAPGTAISPFTLNLPLPFFYSRDSGVALPTAALPYNEMRINFAFREWSQLLIMENTSAATLAAGTEQRVVATAGDLVGGIPTLGNTQVWANYAIVSNDERKRMACAPRDILIEQVQTAPRQSFTPATNTQQSFDVRFSHAIKVLFFSVRNTTSAAEWSNYLTASPVTSAAATNFTPSGAADPILQTSLIYENTNRLAQMGSDYFSLVNPYFHAPVIPTETGFHEYSYSLDFICLDPMGSTNYGKLTNVSVVPEASTAAVTAANGADVVGSGASFQQTFEFIITAVNNNIISKSARFSGDKKMAAPYIGEINSFHLVACCA